MFALILMNVNLAPLDVILEVLELLECEIGTFEIAGLLKIQKHLISRVRSVLKRELPTTRGHEVTNITIDLISAAHLRA